MAFVKVTPSCSFPLSVHSTKLQNFDPPSNLEGTDRTLVGNLPDSDVGPLADVESFLGLV